MMLTQELTDHLVGMLKKVNPYRVILFGSHAYGEPKPDSDIDLLVVTQDDFLPKTFAEKNAVYLRVANTILEIEKSIPIDLIVHTKAMHKRFMELGSMFSKKIATDGKVIYESDH